MSDAASFLTEAAEIVQGDRQKKHGDAERSFVAIAELWQAYLDNRRYAPDKPLTPADVAHMMVLLKMARAIRGGAARDHWVDMAGYAALAGELSEAE